MQLNSEVPRTRPIAAPNESGVASVSPWRGGGGWSGAAVCACMHGQDGAGGGLVPGDFLPELRRRQAEVISARAWSVLVSHAQGSSAPNPDCCRC